MFRLRAHRFQAVAGATLLSAAVLAGGGVYRLHRQGGVIPVAGNAVPIAVLPAGATGAAQSGPGYFTVTAAPGQTVCLHALVVNRTHGRLVLTLAPVDAVRTAGGLAYRLPGEARRGVGAWLRLARSTLHLRPAGRRLVDLTLHLPPRIAAGAYAGGLSIALPGEGTTVQSSASIRLQMRLVVAVVVTVATGHRV